MRKAHRGKPVTGEDRQRNKQLSEVKQTLGSFTPEIRLPERQEMRLEKRKIKVGAALK
ncbi:hypothetical protein [Neisseria iguanae]|uniref:hypothetical protein n=1 Tax=Neisseria iguanae TaxID=90242 RepID=UPI00147525FF|nr:hypothetical protein [Neisseria iguanae]